MEEKKEEEVQAPSPEEVLAAAKAVTISKFRANKRVLMIVGAILLALGLIWAGPKMQASLADNVKIMSAETYETSLKAAAKAGARAAEERFANQGWLDRTKEAWFGK